MYGISNSKPYFSNFPKVLLQVLLSFPSPLLPHSIPNLSPSCVRDANQNTGLVTYIGSWSYCVSLALVMLVLVFVVVEVLQFGAELVDVVEG